MTPEQLQAELEKCVRCGRCLSVCPIYKLTGWEGSVARGKLSLLRAELSGEADLGRRMKDLLSHCLLCGACTETCASEVQGDALIQAGRALAMAGGGLTRLRSLLLRDLLSRGPLAQGLQKGRGLMLKNVPPESGLHFRFPVPGLERERWLPSLADRTFLEDSRSRDVRPGAGPRVALFVGCVSNYMRPQMAQSALRLLEAAGAQVLIPQAQVCCGKPAAGAGDEETVMYLARKNVAAFQPEDFDYITTFCATCSEELKEYGRWPDLKGGPDLAARVRDLNDLLVNILDWRPETAHLDESLENCRVFYHDPCHLRRKQGIFREPRALIRALPGVTLVGEDDPPVCCGYGGFFNLWHYPLSQALFKERVDRLAVHRPDLVVTTCSGCWLQFEDGVRSLGRPFSVSPLVELLARRGLPAPAGES